MLKLFYPTLDLLVYGLSEGFMVDEVKQKETYQQFWAELPQYLKPLLKQIDPLEQSENKLKFKGMLGEKENNHVDGSYNRFKIEDTQGFLFDCSAINLIEPEKTISLSELKKLIPDFPAEGIMLGQTWMISGWVSSTQDDELQELAKTLYKDLCGNDWQHEKTGKFLGGTVFEVWRSSQIWEIPEAGSHALIILYPDLQTVKNAGKFYDYWLNLIAYRHKIIFAYNQSRSLKRELKIKFNQAIPKLQDELIDDLKELKKDLMTNAKVIGSYGQLLNLMAIQLETVDINLYNLEKFLELMEEKGRQINDTKLEFIREFTRITKDKYKKQIEKDYQSFSPGLGILTSRIETIRGIVEIKQAERDSGIELAIASAGIGIGIGSASASAFSSSIKDFTPFYPIKVDAKQFPWAEPLSNLMLVLFLSISLGLVFGLLAWKCLHKNR